MSDKILSLDDNNKPTWTFYSSEGGAVKYKTSIEGASLSQLFKNMIRNSVENNKIEGKISIVDNEIKLYVIDQPNEYSEEYHKINTNKMLNYVNLYFELWKDDVDNANYVKAEPVITHDIHHILREKDVKFIEDYISAEIGSILPNISNYTDIIHNKINCLGVLLAQVDEFLNIESLSNKIYAYIATLLFGLSLNDLSYVLNEVPAVKAATDIAITEWSKDNPNKFAQYICEENVGSKYLAPVSNITDRIFVDDFMNDPKDVNDTEDQDDQKNISDQENVDNQEESDDDNEDTDNDQEEADNY